MNYIWSLIEILFVFLLMIIFYRFGKKEGLFLYIGLMASLISILFYKSVDILSFEVQFGLPMIVGIFMCSNIIIQRYGIDENKKIISYFVIPYVFVMAMLGLVSLATSGGYNVSSNNAFNSLYGYNLGNLRIFISGLLSIGLMLGYNNYIYDYIRKSKNKYIFSNVSSILVGQFTESIIFVFVLYVGLSDFDMIFGMMAIRYLLKIVISLFGLVAVSVIMKMKVE